MRDLGEGKLRMLLRNSEVGLRPSLVSLNPR